MATDNERKEIRIDGFNSRIYSDLKTIAENKGVPMTSFLKMELSKVADSYPADMKKKKDRF